MHRILLYAAFGWITLGSTLQFVIDVVSQYVRGKRVPGPETTLYYGLNISFTLGQFLFGLIYLWLTWQAPAIVERPAVVGLAYFAAVAWLAITFSFIEYWEPRIGAGVFAVLLIAATLTA